MTGTLAFIAVIMVSFGIPYYNARTERQRNQTINQLAQVGAALEAYHHANARYPDELQELVPKFLKQFPNDAFGAPLIYRRENGHAPVLYSMGANGADDGGVFVGDGSNDGDLVYGVDQPDVGGTTP